MPPSDPPINDTPPNDASTHASSSAERDPQQGHPALSRRARLRFDRVRSSYVLMLPETAVLLSGSSAEILALCTGERSVQEIVAELQRRYPEADLRADVLEFLDEAHKQRWLA